MSQISKCPNMRVVLTYWEALRDVSGLSYKSLLYFRSNGSYCRTSSHVDLNEVENVKCFEEIIQNVNIYWNKESSSQIEVV